MTEDEILELITRVTILMKHYEESSIQISETAKEKIVQLEQIMVTTREMMDAMVLSSEEKIQIVIDRTIHNSIEMRLAGFEERLQKGIREVEYDISKISKLRSAMEQQTKFFTWKSVILFVGGGLVLLATLFKSSWDMKNKLAEMQTEYQNIQVQTSVKKALNTLSLSSCGGKPCIRLDDTAERWGKKGEYVIIK